jgi:pSer/pThr/pTyr-binding forkhead associated (FHA) protein
MARLALRYRGHRPGADLGYFAGRFDLVEGQTFEVSEAGLVIGRRASADLRVASSMVAPHHVRLTWAAEGALQLEDLRSTNGTKVNGVAVGTCSLKVGDQVSLAGHFDFEVVAPDEGN